MSPIAVAAFGLGLVIGLPQPAIFGLAVLAGGGLTAFSASWYALLADTASERRLGRTFGIINALSTLGIVAGSVAGAELWTRVDIVAGMMVGVIAPFMAGAAMLAYPAAPATLARMTADLRPFLDLDACMERPPRADPDPSVNPPDGGTDVAAGRDPRGGEAAAARYCAEVLEGAGIASEVIELTPGRGSCVARLSASGPATEPPLGAPLPHRRRPGRRGGLDTRPVRRGARRRRRLGPRRDRHEEHGGDGARGDARAAPAPAPTFGAT